MRKVFGALFVVVTLLPAGLLASPAGANPPNCAGVHGTAKFLPPLPAVGSNVKVKSVVVMVGTFTNCAGIGGLTHGTWKATAKFVNGMNCTTLLGTANNTLLATGSQGIRWNDGRNSIVDANNFLLKKSVPGLRMKMLGTVNNTSTQSANRPESGKIRLTAVPATGCANGGTALANATITQVVPGETF